MVEHTPNDHANRIVKLVRRAAASSSVDPVAAAVGGAVDSKTSAKKSAATTKAKAASSVVKAAATSASKATTTSAANAKAATSAVTPAAVTSATTTTTKKSKTTTVSTTSVAPVAATSAVIEPVVTSSAVKAKATTSAIASSAIASTSASAIAGSSNNLASTGSTSTGAVAGGVIAGVVVLGAVAGFFVYRKMKANRAARAGEGLSGGAGAFKKQQDEDDDEMFGNSSSGSAFGGEKSGFSGAHDTYNNGPVLAPGSWAAQEAQMRQQTQQPQDSNRPPSWAQHPYANNGQPTSQNLNSYPPPQSPYAEDANVAQMPAIAEDAAVAPAATPFHDGAGQGEVYIVKRTFEPSLDDELVLFPGDRIQVQVKYDDGWAFGVNLDSGAPQAKGVFPFDCLGDLAPAGGAAGSRAQSPAQEKKSFDKSAGGKTSPSPYQLPTIRSDSPFNAAPPAIRLEDDTGRPRSLVVGGEPSKRTSSLIASRDADLFMALGEVLDKNHQN